MEKSQKGLITQIIFPWKTPGTKSDISKSMPQNRVFQTF